MSQIINLIKIQERFKLSAQQAADIREFEKRFWLRFLAGSQWGDEAPNWLFGAWLNYDGDAV